MLKLAGGLEPAEDLSDPLAELLADSITVVTCATAINGYWKRDWPRRNKTLEKCRNAHLHRCDVVICEHYLEVFQDLHIT